MDYLVLPGTGQKVYPGDVVVLHRFPEIKWVVKHEYYTLNGQQYRGWYFLSIPTKNILPLTEEDLYGITVISGQGEVYPPCPPHPCPPHPCPPPCPPPRPVRFTESMADQLNRAFITVDTLKDRDALVKSGTTDGKIVRVNDIGTGESGYYRYYEAGDTWVVEDFGFGEPYTGPEWTYM